MIEKLIGLTHVSEMCGRSALFDACSPGYAAHVVKHAGELLGAVGGEASSNVGVPVIPSRVLISRSQLSQIEKCSWENFRLETS